MTDTELALRDRRSGFAWVGNDEMAHLRDVTDGRERTTTLAVYVTLCECANSARTDAFRIARARIAGLAGVNIQTLRSALERLERHGLLSIEVGPDGRSSFALLSVGCDLGTLGHVNRDPRACDLEIPEVVFGDPLFKKEEEQLQETEEEQTLVPGEPTPLPGMAPEPPPSSMPETAKEDGSSQAVDVAEVWAYYRKVFGDRLRIKDLTRPRELALKKALKAVDGDTHICMRAIDGLKFYRDGHPNGSQNVAISVIFETGPHEGRNLTEKIEWWASQSPGSSTDRHDIPSVLRARITERRVQVVEMMRHPDPGEGLRQRGEEAMNWLRQEAQEEPIVGDDGRITFRRIDS